MILAACSSSPSSGETSSDRRTDPDAQVHRIELKYMTAGDLAAVLENRFRRELWVRVENRRNAVLISGSADVVTQAMDIAAALDAPPAEPAE